MRVLPLFLLPDFCADAFVFVFRELVAHLVDNILQVLLQRLILQVLLRASYQRSSIQMVISLLFMRYLLLVGLMG